MKKKVESQKLVLQFMGLTNVSCDDLNRWLIFHKNCSMYVPVGTKAVQIHQNNHNIQRTIDNVLKDRGLVPFSRDGAKTTWKAKEAKT